MKLLVNVFQNQKIIILTICALILSTSFFAQNIWINEIKYDNPGADVDDTIEIAGTDNTDLTNYTIELYNGNNGAVYNTIPLSGIIGNEQNGFGAIAFNLGSIQNGPDGIALVDPSNTVIQFLSYEGAFMATDGSANGITSIDIGFGGTSSSGKSLQLQGTGSNYADFNWTEEVTQSYNLINPNQNMIGETFVPDDNFEQALIDLGYDDVLDDKVLTANINTVASLYLPNENIADLTGIEDFVALTYLNCDNNQLTNLDVSANTDLIQLLCYNNELTNLDLSTNTILRNLNCGGNQLTSLNLSTNTALVYLYCFGNLLTSLDLSTNAILAQLYCYNNQLTSLNIANGNNTNIANASFNAQTNPNLTCIEVDDAVYSTANWTNIDAASSFSTNCTTASTDEFELSTHFSIYPNPTKNNFSLKSDLPILKILIYDNLGKLLLKFNPQETYNISSLTNGIYILKVASKNGFGVQRLIIK